MDPAAARLTFLLSLGALPLGCTAGDDAASDASATTGAATSSTTGGATTTESSGDVTGESDATEGAAGPCEARQAKLQGCFPNLYPDVSESVERCELEILRSGEVLGQACADALAAAEGCYAALSCDELSMSTDACDAANVTVDEACAPIPGPTCVDYGETVAMCDASASAEHSAELCQYWISDLEIEFGDECGDAVEDYFACLSGLSCAEADEPGACGGLEGIPCGD
ncbi:MAG: hypothetical protein R3B09_20745 [Nannocystaceae bacterium]